MSSLHTPSSPTLVAPSASALPKADSGHPHPHPVAGPGRIPPIGWSGLLGRLRPSAAASTRTLVLVATAACVAAVAFDSGVGGMGMFVFIVAVSALLVVGGLRRVEALGILGCAVAAAAMLALRDSWWLRAGLVPLAASCLLAAVVVGRRGSWFDVSWRMGWLANSALWLHCFMTPVWAWLGLRTVGSLGGWLRAKAAIRLVVLVAPTLTILMALLASADTLFASIVEFDAGRLVVDSWWFVAGGAAFAALLRCALMGIGDAGDDATGRSDRDHAFRLARVESLSTLVGVAVVLALFVGAQVFAAFDVGRATLAGRGLTYAEYARSGYVQLLLVTAIVALVLIVVDRLGSERFAGRKLLPRTLSILIILLALAVVGVAMHRLALYCEAFGLTMLRLTCVAGAAWVIVVLLVLLAQCVGLGGRRNWVPGAAGLALVVVTVAFALVNPQRIVVEYDLAHAGSVPLDLRYLTAMSADSVPTLIEALPQLTEEQSRKVVDRLCKRFHQPVSWSQTNLSRIRAERSLDSVCER